MTDVPLFDIGDPLNPDRDTVTPPDMVARLTRPQREIRVERLTQQAYDILADGVDAITEHGRYDARVAVAFSGGNDSTVLAHLVRHHVTHAVHANTGIGVEETREFVRRTCAAWDLPLIEKRPPVPYRDLVLDQGFPGPAMHYKMYQRLKERCLEAARRDLVADRPGRVIYVAGRRRAESARRAAVPLWEWKPKQAMGWVSPLALWTAADLVTYRLLHDDVPTNPVTKALGMSGECLCGAFAHPGELDDIRRHYPDTAAHIDRLQDEVRADGRHPGYDTWGHGKGRPSATGPMCSSCDARRQDALFDIDDQPPSPALTAARERIRTRRQNA